MNVQLPDTENAEQKIAAEFIFHTNQSLYITGNAGTGKTTFLKFIQKNCTKNQITIAPTGVAAINAGGVTAHAFFQLPLAPYIASIPGGFRDNQAVVNKHTFLKNLRLSNTKRDIIQHLELLIVDEVSMLRADMLDAIDTVLKHIRRNQEPMGGVQTIFIGDLYQLAPVVTESDKQLLSQHYNSAYFFDANVYKMLQPAIIEFKKIYRQQDEEFIRILNAIRTASVSQHDLTHINSRYQSKQVSTNTDAILLTTHNAIADKTNTEALHRLDGKSYRYHAVVEGDFGQKQYPVEEVLELKVGAKIMFLRNDTNEPKRYFNGKIATVTYLDENTIRVTPQGESDEIEVQKELWENNTYEYNTASQEVKQKTIGEFTQYPLRLAWAVTIHKSQGLTFDRVIIDAARSFAPGQVYVAMSRCRTLNGIILTSPIYASSIMSDPMIHRFHTYTLSQHELLGILQAKKNEFEIHHIHSLFNWSYWHDEIQTWLNTLLSSKSATKIEGLKTYIELLNLNFKKLNEVKNKFMPELNALLQIHMQNPHHKPLISRLQKAIPYFTKHIHETILTISVDFFNKIPSNVKTKKTQSAYNQCIASTKQLMHRMQNLYLANEYIIAPEQRIIISDKPLNEKTTKVKGATFRETLAYFLAGKSIDEIATLRNYAVSTIEEHLCKMVLAGELDIYKLLSNQEIEEIKHMIHNHPKATLTELHQLLDGKYKHAFIRLISNMKNVQSQ